MYDVCWRDDQRITLAETTEARLAKKSSKAGDKKAKAKEVCYVGNVLHCAKLHPECASRYMHTHVPFVPCFLLKENWKQYQSFGTGARAVDDNVGDSKVNCPLILCNTRSSLACARQPCTVFSAFACMLLFNGAGRLSTCRKPPKSLSTK